MEENLERAGKWLARKTEQCRSCSVGACEGLDHCHQELEFLQEQWQLQVEMQTNPCLVCQPLFVQLQNLIFLFLGQSKNKGKAAIEEAK